MNGAPAVQRTDDCGRPRLTAIVTAMAEELEPFVRRMRVEKTQRLGSCRVHCGTLGGARVVAALTGDGAQRAGAGTDALLESFAADLLIVAGIAGGLSPRLAPESVVVAREVVDAAGPVPPPATAWVDRALERSGVTEATVVSSSDILCTPEAKAEAWIALDHGRAAVVDLESAACARVAARRGVAYVVLRAVCDTADEALPFDLNRCRDDSGQLRRMRVARQALMRPAALGRLLDLRKRTTQGAGHLARLAADLLDGAAS